MLSTTSKKPKVPSGSGTQADRSVSADVLLDGSHFVSPLLFDEEAESDYQLFNGISIDPIQFVTLHETQSPSYQESTDATKLLPRHSELFSGDDLPAAFVSNDGVSEAIPVAQSPYKHVAQTVDPQFQLQQLQLQLELQLQQLQQQQQQQQLQRQQEQLQLQQQLHLLKMPLQLQLQLQLQAQQQQDSFCVDTQTIFQDSLVLSPSSSFPMARDQHQHNQGFALNLNHSSRSASVFSTDQMENMSLNCEDPLFSSSFLALDSHSPSYFGLSQGQMSASSSPSISGSDFGAYQEDENQASDAMSPLEPLSPLPPAPHQPRKKRNRTKSVPVSFPYPLSDQRNGVERYSSISPKILPSRSINQGQSTVLKEPIRTIMTMGPLMSIPAALGLATPASKRVRSASVGGVSCPQCHKLYTRKNNVDTHVKRVHNRERPFSCAWERCSKSFAAKGDYDKHVRLHTGEKPYTCSHFGCKEAFTRSEPRDRHHDREHPGCDGGGNCLLESLSQLTAED